MKKALLLLLALCTVITMSSCVSPSSKDKDTVRTEETHPSSDSEVTASDGTETTAKTPLDTENEDDTTNDTQSEDTTPTTEQPKTFEPYKVKVTRGNFPVYDGPGYDRTETSTVKEAGVYTIIEEAKDSLGNVWGKLKSGAGWIDLTLLDLEENGIVSADYADEALLSGNNYYYYTSNPSHDGVKIAFSARTELSDVSFYSVDMSVGFKRGQELFRIPSWNSSQPFVANVAFAGSMSAYGLSFSDQNGKSYEYTVYTSGRDGSIVLLPVPASETSDATAAAIPQMEMIFCSGVGGWNTILRLSEDGSFAGSFHDSDMGDAGTDYPNGTIYVCDFTGRFEITGQADNSIYLKMTALTEESTPADKWIEDGTLYVSSGAYGLEGGETFILYLPGTPVDTLPEDAMRWGQMSGSINDSDTKLRCYALYCVETGNTFFS